MKRSTVAAREQFSGSAHGIPDLIKQDITLPCETALTEAAPGSLVAFRTMEPVSGSTVHFWIDDYRFEPLWTRPHLWTQRFLGTGVQLVQPDFSMLEGAPYALNLWQLYRSRWLARHWQESGLQVIPSLAWCSQTLAMVGEGIPRGSVVAIEARPIGKPEAVLRRGLIRALERVQPSALLLYGAEQRLTEWCKDRVQTVSLPAWSPRRRITAAR